jgi:DNA-directed RNA polymerase beta subunit
MSENHLESNDTDDMHVEDTTHSTENQNEHTEEIKDEQNEMNDEDEELTNQEDAWEVIGCYFSEKGLVRQQLDSYNVFVENTIQELVDDTPEIELTSEQQHNPGQEVEEPKVLSDDVYS